MYSLLKRLASALPPRAQQELKRLHFGRQLRAGSFSTAEPEFTRLPCWISAGDWVIDVGANVGHYTVRLAQLVGSTGRVLAFEPVPATFELLAANVSAAGACNVSLFNVAISSQSAVMGISMPRFDSGLTNYYRAGLTSAGGEFDVVTMALDSIMPAKRVALIKIDVEGHELQALRGMQRLLRRDRPRLIVEGTSEEVSAFLAELNYQFDQFPQSPNRVFSAPRTEME
jgi:FkbM family methyltransferase